MHHKYVHNVNGHALDMVYIYIIRNNINLKTAVSVDFL